MRACATVHVLPVRVVVSSSACRRTLTCSSVGNELGSGQERVQTQQTMARWGTAGNGISGGLQMCQLECELHVRYANERKAIWLGPSLTTAACHRLVGGGEPRWLHQFVLYIMLYGLLIQGKGNYFNVSVLSKAH